jgi:hypothetical protein
LERLQDLLAEPQLFERDLDVLIVEDSDDDLLTERERQGTHSEVDWAAFHHDMDAAVLWQAALADIHVGHDLDARRDRRREVHGGLERQVQRPVDTIADPQLPLGRLDVDVAGPLLDRIVNNVIHEPDDGALPGDVGGRGDVGDRLLDQLDGVLRRVVDDVVDDEHPRVGHVGLHHPADVFGACDRNLHFATGEIPQLVEQEDIGRLGHGDRQHIPHAEERQNRMFFDEFARNQLEHLGVEHAAVEPHVWNTEFHCQAFEDLVLAAELPFEQHFAEQLFPETLFLASERGLELLRGQMTFADEQIAKPEFWFEQRTMHGIQGSPNDRPVGQAFGPEE